MRIDLFVKKNIFLLLEGSLIFSGFEKEELLKLPRSFWQKEIILGNIKTKNKLVKPSFSIENKDIYLLNIDWKNIKNNWNIFYREHFIDYPLPLEILLSNEGFLVVNKPAGISVHPVFPLNQKRPRDVSLVEGIISYYPNMEGKLVHRLDKETSGVILFARNNKTKVYLKKQFKNRKVKKEYYALVEDVFPVDEFCLEGNIGKSLKNPTLRKMSDLKVIDTNIKEASTKVALNNQIINPKHSQTLGKKIKSGTLDELAKTKPPISTILGTWKKYMKNNKKKYTVLKLSPKTGRTHQLRVQLASAGYPIVGDKLYGNPVYRGLPFHCLHAYSLGWSTAQGKKYSIKTPEITFLRS